MLHLGLPGTKTAIEQKNITSSRTLIVIICVRGIKIASQNRIRMFTKCQSRVSGGVEVAQRIGNDGCNTRAAIEGPKAVVELLIYIDDIGIFTKNDDE